MGEVVMVLFGCDESQMVPNHRVSSIMLKET